MNHSDLLLDAARFREEMKPYFDEIGLVCPHPGQGSGNGLLYLAEYVMTLHMSGWLTTHDHLSFLSALTKCNAGLPSGLYGRAPWNKDQEGPDDYIGIAAAASVCGYPHVAGDILEYGRSNPVKLWGPIKLKYVYNNELPGTFKHRDGRTNWSAWMGRNVSLIAHIQFAAGEKVSWWRKLAWIYAVLSATRHPDDQDEWILSWMLIQTARGRFGEGLWKAAFQTVELAWTGSLYKHWPGGLNQVLKKYFNHDHPIATRFVT